MSSPNHPDEEDGEIEVTFNGESWNGGDGSELSAELLAFLNRNTSPRHSPTDPEDLEAIGVNVVIYAMTH